MTLDTTVICKECGGAEDVSFAYCLRHGWPSCCQEVMRLTSVEDGAIERAVDEAFAGTFAFDHLRLERDAIGELLAQRARDMAALAQQFAESIARFDGHEAGTCECVNCTLARRCSELANDYLAAL